jgi:TPR repeat protein
MLKKCSSASSRSPRALPSPHFPLPPLRAALLPGAAALAASACSSSGARTAAPTEAEPEQNDPIAAKCEAHEPLACMAIAKALEIQGEEGKERRAALQKRFGRGCDDDDKRCFALAWVIEDPMRAVLLYQRSCDAGVAVACHMFGLNAEAIAEEEPDAERKDTMYTAAFVTFGMACDGGFHDGCLSKAKMQYAGTGRPRDLEGAKATLQVPCKAGNEEACQIIPVLECQQGMRLEGCPDVAAPTMAPAP